MGGRKASRIERVVGTLDKLKPNKREFINAVQTEKPEKIISSAINFLSSSDQAISNIAKAARLLEFISSNKNKNEAPYQDRKEEVTDEWAQIKKKDNLKTSSEIDRIFIESATKVIRRGKK